MSDTERNEIAIQAKFWKAEILHCLEMAERCADFPELWRQHCHAAKVARLRYIREVIERTDALEGGAP